MQITFNPIDEKERYYVFMLLEAMKSTSLKAPQVDFDFKRSETSTITAAEAFGAGLDTGTPENSKYIPINAVTAVTDSFDAAGLPWDARIHSSTKAKTANNMWRIKRGVHPDIVKQVEGELRQLMNAPTVTVSAPPPPTAPVYVPPAPEPTQMVTGITDAPSPSLPPAPINEMPPIPANLARAAIPASPVGSEHPPSPPAAPDADGRKAFVNLVQMSVKATNARVITEDEVKQICAQYGVASIPLLANRLDLVPAVALSVEQLIASRANA